MTTMLDRDSLGAALYRYLVDHMYGVPPEKRRRCGWVMNTEWMDECKRLGGVPGEGPQAPKPTMLGLPILAVRDSGGVPHLEVID